MFKIFKKLTTWTALVLLGSSATFCQSSATDVDTDTTSPMTIAVEGMTDLSPMPSPIVDGAPVVEGMSATETFPAGTSSSIDKPMPHGASIDPRDAFSTATGARSDLTEDKGKTDKAKQKDDDPPSQRVRGRRRLIDAEALHAARSAPTITIEKVIKETGIVDLQKALTKASEDGDVERVLDAALALAEGYRQFLKGVHEVYPPLNRAARAVEKAKASVADYVDQRDQGEGIDLSSKLRRTEDALARIAAQIRVAEEKGNDTTFLRASFTRLVATRRLIEGLLLRSAEDGGEDEATRLALQLRSTLDAMLTEISSTEQLLLVASSSIEHELELLNLGTDVMALTMDLKNIRELPTLEQLQIGGKSFASWLESLGSTHRVFLDSLTGIAQPRVVGVARPGDVSEKAFEREISRYAKAGGWKPKAKPKSVHTNDKQ